MSLNNISGETVIPTTNRQAGNKNRKDRGKEKDKTIFKIDYLRLSIPDVFRGQLQDIIQNVVGKKWKDCKKVPNTSYRKARQCGKVKICFDDHYKRQRFSLVISSGAEPFRFIFIVPWLVSEGATVRRIDLAFDDLGGITSMRKIKTSFEKQEIVSRFRKTNIIWDYKTQRSTLRVGSRCSDTFIRVYEKPIFDVPEYQALNKNGLFMRWEVELKNRNAQRFVEKCFLREDKLGGVFPVSRKRETLKQILHFEAGRFFYEKLSFRHREGFKNISRAHLKPWWKKFVLSI